MSQPKTQIANRRVEIVLAKKAFTAVYLLFLFTFTLFYSETLYANGRCEALFSDVTQQSTNVGAQFLLSKDQNLHTSEAVQKSAEKYKEKTGSTLQKPVDKVTQWLVYLEGVAVKTETNPQLLTRLKESLYEKNVINKDSIPESYFEFQSRLAQERGHGEVRFNQKQKDQHADILITDQKNLWTTG